jgi:hypothetical protein
VKSDEADSGGGHDSGELLRAAHGTERPQATRVASSPPREPPELLHVEGEAATERIDGGGGLGFGVWQRRGAARVLGERDRVGGGGGFIGDGDRPWFAGPRDEAQGLRQARRGRHRVRPGAARVRPEVRDDHRDPLVSGTRRRRAAQASWATVRWAARLKWAEASGLQGGVRGRPMNFGCCAEKKREDDRFEI